MRKLYYCLFTIFLTTNILNAQETISFLGYDGTGSTVTATTSTVNNDITIVFEDLNIIDNFYTDFQDNIHMYGGLDTNAGGWQGAPDFSDLGAQPILALTDGDNNAAPNTYSITINLADHYSAVPNGTMIYGFNLLFQNQHGGGGNNQTVDFYIDLVDALKDSTLSLDESNENSIKLFVKHSNLHINGLNGNAELSVYNVLGQEILNKRIQASTSTIVPLDIQDKALYIVKLKTKNFTKTIKTILK